MLNITQPMGMLCILIQKFASRTHALKLHFIASQQHCNNLLCTIKKLYGDRDRLSQGYILNLKSHQGILFWV